MRVIKKYPNRRLYDATASRYVTLDDILRLVLGETPFQVVERKTNADITRAILLQVVADQERRGPVLLSESLLRQLICAYGSATAARLSESLERSVAQLLRPGIDVGGASARTPRGT